ncbi:MAG: DUF2520 domain-containing protein [Saprospiraceae bacterium]|nr:DUF2520 domain-containing protein [Saprospiraceae bacterium]
MDIAIVGSGNMSSKLIPAFINAGFHVSGIYGRNKTTTNELATRHHLTVYNEIGEVDASIVFLCVSDDSIADVSSGFKGHRAMLVHTSGSVSSNVLQTVEKYGVLYPVQSMTRSGKVNFTKVPICVTASDESSLDILQTLASTVSEHVYPMSDVQRLNVHLAAVMTNNFINHLVVKAKDHLEEKGLDYEILLPLLRFTLEKLTQKPYNFQQTGPAQRRDQRVISSHLDLLKDQPHLLDIYQSITKSIIQDEDHS